MAQLLSDKSKLVPPLIVAVVIAVGATLIILLTSGPDTGGSSSQASSAGGAAAGSGTAVEIKNFAFGPSTLNVKQGASVTFTNDDSAPHTATADDKSFDTGNLNQGDSKTVSFSAPGTIAYTCAIHPFMHGTIVVQ
jgi:plastocyanin